MFDSLALGERPVESIHNALGSRVAVEFEFYGHLTSLHDYWLVLVFFSFFFLLNLVEVFSCSVLCFSYHQHNLAVEQHL